MIQPAGAVHEPKSYTKEGKHGMAWHWDSRLVKDKLSCSAWRGTLPPRIQSSISTRQAIIV
jgi:hypothetical protein